MTDLIKLHPDFKGQWLAALRSGKYVQTNGKLYRGNDEEGHKKMCCLGVACDIQGAVWTPIEDGSIFGTANDQTYGSYPREADVGTDVFAVLQQFMQNPKRPDNKISVNNFLANHNDGGGLGNWEKWTFAQIADWIEANL